jgi:hypothetical protein
MGSRLVLGEAELGPGHRQNGALRQERHFDGTGRHSVGREAPSWLVRCVGFKVGVAVGTQWVKKGTARRITSSRQTH